MSDAFTIRLDPVLTPIVRPAGLLVEDVTAAPADAALDAGLAEAERAVRASPPAERLAVRAMYRQTGLDPTRRRPSSEALLRRVVRGEALPRINTLVDIGNWCSLEFQIPYGLYDADRLEGPVVLRLGGEGEAYAGIRKDVVHLAGRMVLADDRGPFGNPSSDSARTMVTTSTTRCLIVIFAPAGTERAALDEALERTAARVGRYGGGRETGRFVL